MNERESLAESIKHLGADLGDLVRAELAQFKRELTTEGRKLAVAGIWLAGAAVMGLAFLGVFTAFAVIVLTLVFQPWLAALIITVAWGFVAISMLAAAKMKLNSALPIELETTRSVKEDIEWIKSGIKSAK
ncbi:MAG TPA: phage holin family protein [Candidatus Baltobacteraceae bacterium]|nr:phage holin family protein [Candidatus Baltobacteraceae bacterium]